MGQGKVDEEREVRGYEKKGGGEGMAWEGGCGWGLEWRYMGRHTVQKWVEGKTVDW